MKKIITTALLAFTLMFAVTGCVSNLETDRDYVASAAISYESTLDGLTAARKSGLLDDDAYKRIDPVVDTAYSMLIALKERVDAGDEVSDESLDRFDKVLDFLLEVLLQFDDSQSQIDRVYDMKSQLNEMRLA